MTFIGSYMFSTVISAFCQSFQAFYVQLTEDEFEYSREKDLVTFADLSSLSVGAWAACAGLGFSLSFLFFIDQNITSAIVNNPQMK